MWSSVTRFASPNGEHKVLLDNVGEIRFGPPYYALSLRGRALPSRFFGNAIKWSDDSRLVAVQEWLSLTESSGPRTKLVLINAANWTETDIVIVEGGFVRPIAFTQGNIRFTADYIGGGRQVVFEHEIPSGSSWHPLP